MKRLWLSFGLVALCLVLSCSENRCPCEPDCGDYCYPLAIGNRWEYSRVDSFFNYRHETRAASLLGFSWTYTVEIARTEILPGCMEAFVFHEVSTWESSDPHESETYCRNERDGLYRYAYRGIAWISPFAPRETRLRFKGRDFHSIEEVVLFVEELLLQADIVDDSLRFSSPPIKVLQYPLEIAAEWVLTDPGDPWHVAKRVTGKEDVDVPAGKFSCYSVQVLADLDDDGEWDEDFTYIDYIGPVGLVRRYMYLKDIEETTAGGEVVGWFDVIDDSKLVDVQLE
jgi:hypothetical protein